MAWLALACSCDVGLIDCSYASAQIVFRGHVDFNNDDGSGTFVQQTLIRFKVDEIFKGRASATGHIWVDPGSFTSCYAEYSRDKEYLMFAFAGGQVPTQTSAVTVVGTVDSAKPLPEEFRSGHPPAVYLAPECSGSRDVDYPTFDKDLATLRRYSNGAPVAPIVGRALLAPYYPWSGKGTLSGAKITLHTGRGKVLTASTNSDGKFFFDALLPNGEYKISAEYPGTTGTNSVLYVFSQKCSHIVLSLHSTHSIGGIVKDAEGKPVKGVTVSAIFASPEDRDSGEFEPVRTDAEGRFQLRGVPPVPVRVGVFQKAADGAATPERAFYYPAAITTHDGSQDPNIEIQVPNRW